MFNFPPAIAASMWQDRDAAVYDAQVQEALVYRRLEAGDGAMLAALLAQMHFDTRKDGFGGLVLKEDVAAMALPRGMRLLEEGPVIDLHRVDEIRPPYTLTSFDSRGGHVFNFMCPLFNIPGFTVEALHLDVMHVLDLGVTQYLIGTVIMALIEGKFCKSDFMYVGMRWQANLKQLRLRLRAYYEGVKRERGKMSQIGRLSIPMRSTVATPRLKAKAAESRNLVDLLPLLCEEHQDCLGERGMYLKMSCTQLHTFYNSM